MFSKVCRNSAGISSQVFLDLCLKEQGAICLLSLSVLSHGHWRDVFHDISYHHIVVRLLCLLHSSPGFQHEEL